MNQYFAIGSIAADARHWMCRPNPILQAPRNEKAAALKTNLPGLRNGLFLSFSVFTLLLLPVQAISCLSSMFSDRLCNQAVSPTQDPP